MQAGRGTELPMVLESKSSRLNLPGKQKQLKGEPPMQTLTERSHLNLLSKQRRLLLPTKIIVECMRRETLTIQDQEIWETIIKGKEADIHDKGAYLQEVLESSNKPIGDNDDNIDNVKGKEFSPSKGNGAVQLLGAPDGWVPPGPPSTWDGYQAKENAPPLGNSDNPGLCSLYLFGPRYKTGSVYSGHFTPTGAMVLPTNEYGQLKLNRW
jgi:hypothetical protein